MAPREKAVFERYLEVTDPSTAAPTPEPPKAVFELLEQQREASVEPAEENSDGEGDA